MSKTHYFLFCYVLSLSMLLKWFPSIVSVAVWWEYCVMVWHYSSPPGPVFGDVMLVAWNQLWQKDFHRGSGEYCNSGHIYININRLYPVSPLQSQLVNILQHISSESWLQSYRNIPGALTMPERKGVSFFVKTIVCEGTRTYFRLTMTFNSSQNSLIISSLFL